MAEANRTSAHRLREETMRAPTALTALRPPVRTRTRRPPLPRTHATRSGSSVPFSRTLPRPLPGASDAPGLPGDSRPLGGAGPPPLIFAPARSQLRSVALGPCCRRSHFPPVRDGTKGRASHPRRRGSLSGPRWSDPRRRRPAPSGFRPQSSGRHPRTSATTIRAAARAASACSRR